MSALPAVVVARRILDLRRELITTHLHVQKFVYLCHGWMLGLREVPLIKEEIQAWRYGPVIREIYDEYKYFGRNPIELPAGIDLEAEFKSISDDQDKLIKSVVKAYGPLDALYLSALTHTEGTPWHKRKSAGEINRHGTVIPNEELKAYYKKLAASKGMTWETEIE